MRNIEIKVLNPWAITNSEEMMVAMARLTQRGHLIKEMHDFEALLEKTYTNDLVGTLASMPHPTLQKFGVINVAVVGASRRFLAQITRHQNEVKFMSGSLQYSDYSDQGQFVVPYEIIEYDNALPKPILHEAYLNQCEMDMQNYKELASRVGHDAAGYATPQGLRNILLISATPYQFKHMISQRTCMRNSLETQYVMLRIWEELAELSEIFRDAGPKCMYGPCPERGMTCGTPICRSASPSVILDSNFELLR